ncbi:MAG TPA: BTAD domain-containing putative transcriptional regulator [Jiangellaceae bacterium]|nr:BTAD domain-containing putative transcriptional regulator [Jiangellaceae bacterium]
MRIGMLGPLEVRDRDGASVPVAGARLRGLLIELALAPGKLVPMAQLVDAVWGDEPPAGAGNALQALVSRLRRAVPEAVVESHPAGYRLLIDPDAVDVSRFERLVTDGRAALPDDAARAASTLREALSLWRGPALLDVAEVDFFQPTLTRLDELRLTATEVRVEADLQLGRGAGLVTELTALVAEHPLRERMVGALMRALSEAGRPAEALTVYERTRQTLADHLGADPSPQLSAVHTAVLRGEIDQAPAPTAEAARRTNLRTPLTSFVGRDADVAVVSELVDDYRLTTLVGPGGFGKTRLAVEVARALLDKMPDGLWLVELAEVADGAGVPAAVLAALDLREPSLVGREKAEDPVGRLIAALRSRSALLVLDNCEHVIAAAAVLADRLLAECPRLRVLATSREPLGITGEAVWPVDPLGLPPEDVDSRDVLGYDAVRLLVDRARAVRPGFTVTNDNAPAVARICRVLDGMPLAIELAAARMRTMAVAQLAERLDDRFRLLTGGSRTAVPRHQTLRAVVDWSWELLPDAERVLLRRMAVFTGGATLEAAQRVCADVFAPADHLLDVLAALVDKSLLVVSGDEVPRYRMLETIRAYGLERLDEAGEREALRRAHAKYFVELAEAAEPHLRRAEQLVWLRRLKADHDNLNAALRGSIAAGDAQTAVRLVAAAGFYWWLGGHKADAMELATEALAVPGAADDEARATAYAMVGWFASAGLGGLEQAEPWIRTAQELTKGIENPCPLLRYFVQMGALLQTEHAPGQSADDLMQSLIADEDPWVRGVARLTRNRMLRAGEQEADIQQALVEFRSIGERWGISYALATLADLAARRGDLVEALDYGERAADVLTELGAVDDLVFLKAKEAQLRWLVGDETGSAAAMAQAEEDAASVGWPDAVAGMAYFKADLARWSGDSTTARAELAHAEALLGHTGIDPVFRAMILDSFAYLDAADGDLDSAGARREEALAIALGSRDDGLVSQVLVGVADQAVRRGYPTLAARLLAASEGISGGPDLSRPDSAQVEAITRTGLGDPQFADVIKQARKEFADARRGPATTEAVRELTASALS